MQLDKDDIDALLGDAGFRHVLLLSTWRRGNVFVFVDDGYIVIWRGNEALFRRDFPVDFGEFMEALARAELKG